MVSSIKIIISFFFLLIVFSACKDKKPKQEAVPIALENETSTSSAKVRQIFYNMYQPTEMSKLFERVGANYNPAILNSADNISRYTTQHQIALNLGLYGVDISYTRIFDQSASTAKYFSTIQLLTAKLGIPDFYFQNILVALDKYRSDKDSLTKLAGDVYEVADKFLKENNKDAFAALVVMGGWIEALYIASKIAESDPENMEIKDRIGEQKYYLNSLISLLSNYQEDLSITENLLMLKKLKKSFDKFEIYYNQKSFKVDTVNKLISTSDYVVNVSPEIISEIGAIVSEIRMGIIN
jgi:hypothetical protein